ncbi:MAG TPA: BON domain-containing protein [Candidatus Binataceae bacterium]|nr:BON domain-containing protein [Candidatus Binataceae bacterium]
MKSFTNSPVASSPADMTLMTQVRGALLSDPRLERCAIEVRCDDGTVTLRGEVPKAELAMRSQQLALAVDGVDLVQIELTWTDEELLKV